MARTPNGGVRDRRPLWVLGRGDVDEAQVVDGTQGVVPDDDVDTGVGRVLQPDGLALTMEPVGEEALQDRLQGAHRLAPGCPAVRAGRPRWPAARGWLAAMVKTAPPPEILGRPLSDSGVRSRYDITVVGVKRPGRGVTHATPTPSCTRATF